MSRNSLISEIGEWLVDQALSDPDIVEMFTALCDRLYGIGVPIARARLTWPTLHPLFGAETILWKKGQETEFEQFMHQEDVTDAWLSSPMAYMFENAIYEVRRNLDGPDKMIDFPILEDLIEQGMTDYLAIVTGFDGKPLSREDGPTGRNRGLTGFILTWACDREGGFTDDDIVALQRTQRRFAVACKTAVQQRIATNIVETYLGRKAGREVLAGAIKLGDGNVTKAVVWYADMRNSTALADTMPGSAFIELLNDYFACTAGAAIEFGGEVLDFVGDAVLAIFPYEDEPGKAQAIRCATMAMDLTLENLEATNNRRRDAGLATFDLGIGINAGELVFGNIGVKERLSFSVIGPTINEVARIETLTKAVDSKALVSQEVAALEPDRWQSIGLQKLDGVSHDCELFAPKLKAESGPQKQKSGELGKIALH